MIDIYYCKFFTIKHRGLHVLDPLIRVHSTYRFTRHPSSECTRALGAWCTTYTCACAVEFFPQLSKKSFSLKLVKTLMSIGSARDNLNMHITGIPDM